MFRRYSPRDHVPLSDLLAERHKSLRGYPRGCWIIQRWYPGRRWHVWRASDWSKRRVTERRSARIVGRTGWPFILRQRSIRVYKPKRSK